MVQSFLGVEAGAVCRHALPISALFQYVPRYWGSQQQEAQDRSWAMYKGREVNTGHCLSAPPLLPGAIEEKWGASICPISCPQWGNSALSEAPMGCSPLIF